MKMVINLLLMMIMTTFTMDDLLCEFVCVCVCVLNARNGDNDGGKSKALSFFVDVRGIRVVANGVVEVEYFCERC